MCVMCHVFFFWSRENDPPPPLQIQRAAFFLWRVFLWNKMITLTPFGLDDFADSLHYTKGESVMVAEVHTRLLSVILR